jgi:polysaccharide deacetylase family protein (PEP-CTERM system associated)
MYTNLVSTPAANERFRDTQSRSDALRTHADETVNALTIDVEDYFQVSAFAPFIDRANWDSIPCRAEANVMRILGWLDEHGAKATFFTLGWIAERYPAIVREIVGRGHELASHGYGHQRASDQTRPEFTDDIVRAKALLEDIGGVAVRGYRAPSFSINQDNLWALDCILEAGYRYSSSIYPVRHDHYGMPDAPRFAYASLPNLIEVPPTTVDLFNRNWPAAGGGWFRLLPYPMSRWLLHRVNRVDGEPCMFYFHPWEVDPLQPRVDGIDARTRFRHYVNLDRMQGRLARLLQDFRWDRVDRVFLHDAR